MIRDRFGKERITFEFDPTLKIHIAAQSKSEDYVYFVYRIRIGPQIGITRD